MARRTEPRPLDGRWVPALIACLALGLWAPGAEGGAVARASVACALAAVAAGLGLLLLSRWDPHGGGRPGAGGSPWSGPLAALVLAGLAGALLTQQVAAAQAARERSGWTAAVASGEPVRVEVALDAAPAPRAGGFGPRWGASGTVTRFGRPLQSLPHPPSAWITGDGEPPVGVGPAVTARACLVASPRTDGERLTLRAQAPPTPGPCSAAAAAAAAQDGAPAEDAPPPRGDGPTGREALRAAFRATAAGTVGTAPELIPGLVLGDRSVQSPELGEAMKTAGLSHLSAVSGANCALLSGAVVVALRSARVHRHAVTAAVLATLGVFVVIVGPEPSVLRAAVMGALGALAVFFGRGREAFGLLAVGGTGLLVAVPALAVEPAFHLSLAATAGIVLGAAPADRWMHAALLRRRMPDTPARWISASLSVTAAAHLACQPILLAMTGTLSTYAVPANLLAAPFVAPITVLGTLAAGLVLLVPPLAGALVWLTQWPAAAIGAVALTAADLPGATRPWPDGPLGVTLGLLLTAATLAGFGAVLVLERRPPAPVRRQGRSAPRGRVRVSALAVLTCTLLASATGTVAAVMVPRLAPGAPDGWAAAFCDVGQGDMAVFRTGERSALVVDVGPDPEPARRCLGDLGVERVDAVLLTHLHADHAGGLAGLDGPLSPREVRYATRDGASAPPGAGSRARGWGAGGGRSSGEAAGTDAPGGGRRLSTGETGSAGDAAWTVLLADGRALEENDASAQVLVRVERPEGAVTALITGDLEQGSGAAWASGSRSDAGPPPQVDVLKVSHHGARNGGLEVPRAVRARLQVISVGADNPYGHPHPQTVTGLESLAPVARTDRHGTVAVVPRGTGQGPTPLEVRTVRPPSRTR